jgi:predicted deacylase
MDILGYTFGEGEQSCCIVGALRGNEIQQMAICAQLVNTLKRLEENGCIISGKRIMVIPCANYYSMNIGKRFWTMDNTDINRMFPGYDQGETTQRIANGLFKSICDYKYGIQMASFYLEGEFLPHIKMMDTNPNTRRASGDVDQMSQNGDNGSEKQETYESLVNFGLPYGIIRTPIPYDTATLNYNWQIWGCHAFSLFAAYTDHIGRQSTQTAINAILRFLITKGILKWTLHPGSHTRIIKEESISNLKTSYAGILIKHVKVGEDVNEGDLLCEVVHPLEGNTIGRIVSPVDGTVFFAFDKQLVMEHTDVFKIVPSYI